MIMRTCRVYTSEEIGRQTYHFADAYTGGHSSIRESRWIQNRKMGYIIPSGCSSILEHSSNRCFVSLSEFSKHL